MAKYTVHVNGNNPVRVLSSTGQVMNLNTPSQTVAPVAPQTVQTVAPQTPDQQAQVVQQIAQQEAAKQLQQQQEQKQEEQDELRNSVNEIIKNNLMQNIEMPKQTTISDILNGKTFGERLELFNKYLDTPQAQRNFGNLFGTTLYNPQTGRYESTGDRLAREKAAEIEKQRQEALQQIKDRNKLATDLYSAYETRDQKKAERDLKKELADQELEWAREKFNQEFGWSKEKFNKEFGLKQQKLGDDARHRRTMEGIALQKLYGGGSSKGGVATGGAANAGGNLNNIKMTAAERKQLTENKTTLANIGSALKALEKNKNAYNPIGGLVPATISNLYASATGKAGDIDARAQIDNVTAIYRKWLTGAQMSDKERKAYERFLPAPTDNYITVKSKLNSMKGAIERSNNAILSNYGISNTNNTEKKDSLGLGL